MLDKKSKITPVKSAYYKTVARRPKFSALNCSESEDFLDFALPTHSLSWNESKGFKWDNSECKTDCSWFGFKISVKKDAPFTRTDLAKWHGSLISAAVRGNLNVYGMGVGPSVTDGLEQLNPVSLARLLLSEETK